jgi:histidinol dehydrogenase
MKQFKAGKERSTVQTKEFRDAVGDIIENVRENGDKAVCEYSKKFDGTVRDSLRVSEDEVSRAIEVCPKAELDAMRAALDNIRSFAMAQKAAIQENLEFKVADGLTLGHKVIPVDSVCCYVPGGTYPLFSTAMMLITPAKIAGVKRIAVCSPVMKGTESINSKTLAAMGLAGADEIYAVGGAQAIAAFAYGTKQIKNVDLIVGPGNAYVAEAKRQCYGQVGIDFVAGPSEVLIIADDSADPAIIAADLLAQCEHDRLAQGILVTTSQAIAEKTATEVQKQLKTLATEPVASESWGNFGEIIIVDNIDEAASYVNIRAPEHLELQTKENSNLIPKLRNYGSLFIGSSSAEVFGDYAAGTNHTLPTLRAARYTGGLWVGTFLKTLTFQQSTKSAAAKLSPLVSTLAKAEGLAAHSAAADRRGF